MPFEWWPPDGPFPPASGGIRGPDQRTLTDLHNLIALTNTALTAMALQMAGMASDITQMRDDLRRVAGDPATVASGWLGLPHFMRTSIGPAGLSDTSTLHGKIFSQDQRLITIMNSVLQAGMPTVPPSPMKQAVDAINANMARLAAIETDIQALSSVAGLVTDAPNGLTVKGLLANNGTVLSELLACCEEGNIISQPENPAPAEACANNGTVADRRVSTIIELDPSGIGGTPGETIAGLDFGSPSEGGLAYDATASAEANYPVYQNTSGAALNGCVTWDLTDNAAPPWTVERVLVEDVGGTWTATLSTLIGTAYSSAPGGGTWSMGTGTRSTFRIRYPDGESSPLPGKNFFLSWGPDLG